VEAQTDKKMIRRHTKYMKILIKWKHRQTKR